MTLSSSAADQTPEVDHLYLRSVIEASKRARAAGELPFAAMVVAADGQILAEAQNVRRGDCTQHAELEAVRIASRRFPPDLLREATLYSSAEPCAMCAGAIYWGGFGRVVYALSEKRLLELTGNHPENPTLSLPCREVFNCGQRAVTVLGPLLEDEAEAAHISFWQLSRSISLPTTPKSQS